MTSIISECNNNVARKNKIKINIENNKLSIRGSGLPTPESSNNNNNNNNNNSGIISPTHAKKMRYNSNKHSSPNRIKKDKNSQKKMYVGINKKTLISKISRIGMRKKQKKKDATSKKHTKKKTMKLLKTNTDSTADDIRALIEKVAVEFDKNNPSLGPWVTDDSPIIADENYEDKSKRKKKTTKIQSSRLVSSSIDERDDIFQARRIVNGIKLDLMIDDDDVSSVNIIKDIHSINGGIDSEKSSILMHHDLKKEEDDINRRTRLLEYEMNELKIRKIQLLVHKNRNDLQNHAINTYKQIDYGSKEKINNKILLLRQDYTDRCEQIKLLEKELNNKIQLLTNMKHAVEKQRIYFMDSCKKAEASIEVQRLEYLEKFKKKLLVEMNTKLKNIIERNGWNDVVVISTRGSVDNGKKEDKNKEDSEKVGANAKINVSQIMF